MTFRILLPVAITTLGAWLFYDETTSYHDWLTSKLEGALGFVIVAFGLLLIPIAWNGGK